MTKAQGQPTKHPTRRLRRRAWLQLQASLALNEGDEVDAQTLLHRITKNNPSASRRGWCHCTPVSLSQMMRQAEAYGLIKRHQKFKGGSFTYSLPDEGVEEARVRFVHKKTS